MTRRKREIVGLRNERVRRVFLEIDAFHPRTTHPSPPRPRLRQLPRGARRARAGSTVATPSATPLPEKTLQ